MQINSSEFTISSPTVSRCPNDNKAEYAFIGRSNVGKSSLINMLCNHKGLAKTSSMPGKTLLINHFIINKEWYLVDLPGYGYAKRSKKMQKQLEQMIAQYILQREQLVNVFVLIDSRIPPQEIDLRFIDFLGTNGVPLSLVFTKIDKQKQREVAATVNQFKRVLTETWEELPEMMLTSSVTRYGKDDILNRIEEINKQLKENKTQSKQ